MGRRNKDNLVYVARNAKQDGTAFVRRMWVAGDNVRPDDTVLENAQNVRPYRYSAKPEDTAVHDKPAAKRPRNNVKLSRTEAAVLAFFLSLQKD